jgi:hypothetical protein
MKRCFHRQDAKVAKDRKAFMIEFNSLSSASLCDLGGFAVQILPIRAVFFMEQSLV